jgi:hypothetical protein
MAQPKGYAAFILFPHLKMIPRLRKTTMIVPDAVDNSHLNFTGVERSIQVIEVHTFAEAYSAATGQALRHVL